MSKKLIYLMSFVLVLAVTGTASAYQLSITIDNPGFEDPVLVEDDWTWLDVPGWIWVGGEGPGVWNVTSADFDPVVAPEGQNVLYTENAVGDTGGVAQVLTETFAANTDYTLTVEVGNSWYYYNAGYSVQLLAGGVVIAEDNDTLWPDYYTWATSTVEYTYDPADAALVGQPLEIRLLNLALDKDSPPAGDLVGVEFDNITLSYDFDPALASNPNPANRQTDALRDVVLGWTPGAEVGALSPKHNVFFSENFDNVNDGIGGITQDANSYALPQRLDFNTTYYWRVDEANSTTGWDEGDIWQFTTELVAYPIEGNNITATASSSFDASSGPENTINGSGLDVNDLHSTVETDMWLSSDELNGAWIEYEFDKVHKLHEMWVWNHNGMMESVLGFGLKDVTIEHSTNGTDYTTLGTTHEFARAPGVDGYEHNTTVDFGGTAAKYVRLTANSNWGGLLDQYGLSEVRFFHIPVYAREPSPDSGATDVDVDVSLGFRTGREAVTHDVYLSSDEQAVIDGNAPVSTVTETSYGPLSLDLGTTYYWKINEVNEAETPTTWQGDIWNFTTPEFFVVDDFEDYNDYPPDRIYETWIDGYGIPANGATAGYPAPNFLAGEHYVETTIVHGGDQSMPFFYDNTGGATYSEGQRTFAVPQDWTKAGVQTLTLYFRGTGGNTGQLYVEVNGSKVVYDGDAGNLARAGWQAWNIELASFGTNLQSVTTLAIGIDGNGASGTLYFDDFRRYSYSPQFITPVEPNQANLVAHYEFEGTTNESSGNGRHGTAMGSPVFVAGKVGQALSFDGVDDFVEITGYKGILGPNAVTVTAWIKTTDLTDGNSNAIVGWGPNVSGQRFGFRVNAGRIRTEHHGGNVQGDTNMADGQWHHVAVTVKENATISYPDVILWLDGLDDTRPSTDPDAYNIIADQDVRIGSRPAGNDRFFMGLIDDVRIYDYALSLEEVAWLAGRTEPFDKPF